MTSSSSRRTAPTTSRSRRSPRSAWTEPGRGRPGRSAKSCACASRAARAAGPERNFSLDVAGRHVLKPDLVHYLPSPRDGVMRQAVVLDAKFKTRPQRGDLYQMTAYCARLSLAEGHLVYASGRPGVVEVPVGEGRLRIWRHVVDLSRPWRDLASDIDALAASVDTARSSGTV
ncbi:5-methylcytosine restriction system specificity protein McrC [Streptomyces sp. G35A]